MVHRDHVCGGPIVHPIHIAALQGYREESGIPRLLLVLELASWRVRGPEHPDTMTSVQNQRLLCTDEGKYDAAERYTQRSWR